MPTIASTRRNALVRVTWFRVFCMMPPLCKAQGRGAWAHFAAESGGDPEIQRRLALPAASIDSEGVSMRPSSRRTSPLMLILPTAIALAVSVVLAAQSTTSQPPTFKAQANFVRVDVYPTRDGKPVDDLRAEDFEAQEDGAPQAISSFEHVVIPSAASAAARVEPATAAESRQLAADGRSRVFVLFLDLPHVSVEASRDSAGPLIRLLDRLLGRDGRAAHGRRRHRDRAE